MCYYNLLTIPIFRISHLLTNISQGSLWFVCCSIHSPQVFSCVFSTLLYIEVLIFIQSRNESSVIITVYLGLFEPFVSHFGVKELSALYKSIFNGRFTKTILLEIVVENSKPTDSLIDDADLDTILPPKFSFFPEGNLKSLVLSSSSHRDSSHKNRINTVRRWLWPQVLDHAVTKCSYRSTSIYRRYFAQWSIL